MEKIYKKLSMLIQLAQADNEFNVKEMAFIYNVGLRHGVNLEVIGDLIDKPMEYTDIKELTRVEKIECMVDVIQLMLVDGKVLPKEVEFCMMIGKQLGFEAQSLNELIAKVKLSMNITLGELRAKIHQLIFAN